MTLTILGAPEAPETPTGPDYIDVYKDLETEYTTTQSEDAIAYNWNLEPEEAGTVSSDGFNATVLWNQSYLGEAQLSVNTVNACGEGEFSEALNIVVDNTVGMVKPDDDVKVVVAPNPNSGSFKLLINSTEATAINVRLVNTLGTVVFSYEILTPTKEVNYRVNKEALPQGVYVLMVEQGGKLYSKKVVVNR
jgi:hypothetical protein